MAETGQRADAGNAGGDVTEDDLTRWKRLCEAATEGPWRECRADDGGCICGMVYSLPTDTHIATAEGMHNEEKAVPTEVQRKNATFIAESRTALPRLIAAYRAALAENARLRAEPRVNVTRTQWQPNPIIDDTGDHS